MPGTSLWDPEPYASLDHHHCVQEQKEELDLIVERAASASPLTSGRLDKLALEMRRSMVQVTVEEFVSELCINSS